MKKQNQISNFTKNYPLIYRINISANLFKAYTRRRVSGLVVPLTSPQFMICMQVTMCHSERLRMIVLFLFPLSAFVTSRLLPP